MGDLVPKSVEEAASLAEELHQQMFSQEPSEETPQEEEASEEEEEVNEPAEEEEEDEVPDDTDLKELRKFKDRYMILKGKYDAEVPKLAAELRELRQSITQVQQKPTEEPKQEEENPLNKFSEEYGEDFVKDLRNLIALEAQKLVTPVQQQAQSVEEAQIKVAQENFKSYLDNAVADGKWRDLWSGKDPKFAEFLTKPDPSGLYTYGDLVNMYNDNWDADRLARVFNTYLEETKPTTTKPKRTEPSPQQQAMIAPARTSSQPTPKTDTGKIWTQEDISTFQRMDQQGKLSKEDSEAGWNDLLKALNEGRIR